ncbi:putative membrane protein YkoI [Roseiarcus fermentans]|uniref:Putative membrane protein YkoI n=2 Tax=Roseiarcus fermentans TaxID=1473586 RepID=A0A366FTS4_9HYPH|nr:putative membrane protein YkoI [Roseiarcus fermentans]
MAALANVCRAAVAGFVLAGGAHAAEVAACLSASDTREQVRAHKLLEPYAALKTAAQQRKAEALSARLCVNGDDYVYEITLLHRDGRLIHVEMNAGTGKLIARPAHEPKDGRDAHDQPAKN